MPSFTYLDMTSRLVDVDWLRVPIRNSTEGGQNLKPFKTPIGLNLNFGFRCGVTLCQAIWPLQIGLWGVSRPSIPITLWLHGTSEPTLFFRNLRWFPNSRLRRLLLHVLLWQSTEG